MAFRHVVWFSRHQVTRGTQLPEVCEHANGQLQRAFMTLNSKRVQVAIVAKSTMVVKQVQDACRGMKLRKRSTTRTTWSCFPPLLVPDL